MVSVVNGRFVSGLVIAIAIAGGFTLGGATSADAAAANVISVNGAMLDGSTQSIGSFIATASAPVGTTSVKFVLDGKYLGQSLAAPFEWPVVATAGTHKLAVHWRGATSARVTATFRSVAQAAVPARVVLPVATPTTRKKPAISSSTFVVSTAAGLTSALAAARPGEMISLAAGRYVGKFVAAASGTAAAPITITGPTTAVLTTGSITSGYGLHVTGNYWVVKGITVTRSGKGIVLDGSQHTVLSGITVSYIGDEGVHFRDDSSYSSIVSSSVFSTGLSSPGYGEGIYIGSASSNWGSVMGSSSRPDSTNEVSVRDNRISNTAAEGIDVKEGTSGGVIDGNVFLNAGYSGANSGDSWVDVKGNDYLITGNSGAESLADAFQVHQAVAGWGNDNTFSNDTVTSGVTGYLVNVGPRVTGTIVMCQSTKAKLGVSNITCVN